MNTVPRGDVMGRPFIRPDPVFMGPGLRRDDDFGTPHGQRDHWDLSRVPPPGPQVVRIGLTFV
jgi:hypothetical protein